MWKTKEGKIIPYENLKDSHLLNIINFVKITAKKGVSCQRKIYIDTGYDGDSYVPDFIWENDVATEKEVLEHYNYKELLKEAKKRKLTCSK